MMGIRLLLAPWWVRALAGIGYAWLVAGLAELLLWANEQAPHDHHHGSVASSPLWLAGMFGVFPIVVAAMYAAGPQRTRGEYAGAVAGLPATDMAAALKAIWRGPVPTDPAVGAAAIRVGRLYVERQRRVNRRQVFSSCYQTALAVGLALVALVDHNLAGFCAWLAAAVAAVFALLWLRSSARRVQGRIARLSQASTD